MDDPDLYSLPGYRFSPTDNELIDEYLKMKITGKDNKNTGRIPEIDFYKYEPWDLPSNFLDSCYHTRTFIFFENLLLLLLKVGTFFFSKFKKKLGLRIFFPQLYAPYLSL